MTEAPCLCSTIAALPSDTVAGFDFDGADQFVLAVAVAAFDAKVAGGALSAASFDADLSAAITGAHFGRR